MDFSFFSVEIIRGFTSTFLDIYSTTSYPFGFPYRSKLTPLEILKFIFAALRNQDNKVSFIQVDGDGSLERYSGFMKTCHNMNIIVQYAGGDASSLNGKI